MSIKDLIIVIVLMLVCVLGLKPAINNFKVIWRDKKNPKVSASMRRFVLAWSGLGVVAIIFVFFLLAYSISARFGVLPDFKF